VTAALACLNYLWPRFKIQSGTLYLWPDCVFWRVFNWQHIHGLHFSSASALYCLLTTLLISISAPSRLCLCIDNGLRPKCARYDIIIFWSLSVSTTREGGEPRRSPAAARSDLSSLAKLNHGAHLLLPLIITRRELNIAPPCTRSGNNWILRWTGIPRWRRGTRHY
jgi:hypothetical protein